MEPIILIIYKFANTTIARKHFSVHRSEMMSSYSHAVGQSTFLARDSIYAIARYMPSPVRLSVRPSVCHTGGSVKDG